MTSILEQPDGKILVGGSFKSYGGTGRMGLVRLQHDGQLDTEFQSLPSWSVASVSSVALARNGQILIRGFFCHFQQLAPRRSATERRWILGRDIRTR